MRLTINIDVKPGKWRLIDADMPDRLVTIVSAVLQRHMDDGHLDVHAIVCDLDGEDADHEDAIDGDNLNDDVADRRDEPNRDAFEADGLPGRDH